MSEQADECPQCRDGERKINWMIVDGEAYPLGINYHREPDRTIICARCHVALRKVSEGNDDED